MRMRKAKFYRENWIGDWRENWIIFGCGNFTFKLFIFDYVNILLKKVLRMF